ncbi:MAG: hypothetical protein ACRBBO_13345 [Cognatishimia sp.]
MQRLKSIIEENKATFPAFEYYIPIIEKAERFEASRPDTAIDCCNALFQGISKSIILALDNHATSEELDSRNEGKTNKLVKRACECLKQNDDIYEDEFVKKASAMADGISFLRNARGDISHGRAVPKRLQSHQNLAVSCNEVSGSLLSYMLSSFFAMKLDASEEDAQPETSLEFDIEYDQNPDFNEYLDELNPLPGKLLYSEALFQTYLEEYQIQLDDYLDMIEEGEDA